MQTSIFPSLSGFYPLTELSTDIWFNLLVEDQDEKTHLYEVQSDHTFTYQGSILGPDIYLARASEKILNLEGVHKVRKLSFSELVYLSDCYSTELLRFLTPSQDEADALIKEGKVADYFEDIENDFPAFLDASFTLKKMAERVQIKHFNRGIGGKLKRFFSLIANFFLKYDLYLETGIYWPGDSCVYANKVAQKINKLKNLFLSFEEGNKKLLAERLEISLEDFKGMDSQEIKKVWKEKILLVHPDKSPDEGDRFTQINTIFRDFEALQKLHARFYNDQAVDEVDPEVVLVADNKDVHPSKRRIEILRLTAPDFP